MKKLLLDTHAFIWLLDGDPRLSDRALSLLADPVNIAFLSLVSPIEMAVKISIGKLRLSRPIEEYVREGIRQTGMREMPIQLGHACRLANLPMHHRDPFDRLLITTAQAEAMTLLSDDPAMHQYSVDVVW